ncbi:hypothetical protein [Streptomyces europaeiscabiei]|uniref:hypothetical protein n=1 Tax=Streptomyces europaeiscabiei TaxID=146819 RepID=UPI002E165717|nr:hypothetical protein OHB30_28810 [Streptomyces europaeiscabiei]
MGADPLTTPPVLSGRDPRRGQRVPDDGRTWKKTTAVNGKLLKLRSPAKPGGANCVAPGSAVGSAKSIVGIW